MEKHTVHIGSLNTISSGATVDHRREVEFEAEELAKHHDYGEHKGQPTDTRGVTQTLYRTADGQLIVHVEDWSRWQGEPTTYSLHKVSEEDLGPNGQFEALGLEAGMGRPLTLDEALVPAYEE